MIAENLVTIWQLWCRRKYPTYLLLALCFNLVFAATAFAATGDAYSRPQIYALGLLGIATLALSIYLFLVMFQPERF
jgi:K+-transporting ATPase KdpF subunit